jgi:hypothetical protein
MRSTVHRLREPRQVRLAREAHVNVLVAANRFSDEMERRCRVDGISHAQYVALWVLCLSDDADDGLPMRALADGLLNRASDTPASSIAWSTPASPNGSPTRATAGSSSCGPPPRAGTCSPGSPGGCASSSVRSGRP